MSIRRYNEKRDFKGTPEPPGKTRATPRTGALRFVVQKHQASHLHYDFRLELNGVLLSWAVPKGPSLNPQDKRLAMHVEDHPLAYRTFEGVIPEGNYGAGTVMVWDEGTYCADPELGKAANVKQLSEGYHKGKLTFFLAGKKLSGEFSLVRIRSRDAKDNAWLLIKADDEAADRQHDIRDQNRSAVTGRTMAEIAADEEAAVWNSSAQKGSRTRAGNTKAGRESSTVIPANAGRESSAVIPAKAGTQKKSNAAGIAKGMAKGMAKGLAKAALALGGKLADMPEISGPQLATLVDAPFDREGWLFEIKWDGYRALGYHPPREGVSLVSRNGLSFDARFADIAAALQSLPCAAIVDGEVVVLDNEGRSSFARLQRHEDTPAELVYYLFDLLYVDGVDIREVPLSGRKQLLRRLLKNCDSRLQYSDHLETFGCDFFEVAKKNNLEGIIAKDAAAMYYSRRTRHWLKIKIERRQEFIIVGYTAPRRSRSDIGSLLLGYYEQAGGKSTGRLCFAGHVGTGMDTATRAMLKARLDRLARKTSAFAAGPPKTNEPATWVRPELVCEVRFAEKTADGQLRHPVFVGLRTDKPASEIFRDVAESSQAAVEKAIREDSAEDKPARPAAARISPASQAPASTAMARKAQTPSGGRHFGTEAPARASMTLTIGSRTVTVSNPGRSYFPELKLTKLDVINYYRGVAPVLLPYLKDRPFVLHRFPRGIAHESFYQKDNPQDLPEWITTTEIHAESTDENVRYVVCQNEATLVYLVNLGCLEMHPWNSRLRSIDKPDWMIFDLDPLEIGFAKVVEVARVIHAIFAAAKVPHFCKTSGKRGLHVAVPMGAKYTHETVRDMAERIAKLVHHELPASTSMERMPARRRNRIYLDYLQNGPGKTLASPYSLRPIEYAGVSAPLHWDEVNPKLDPKQFTLHTIGERIASVGDLWKGVLTEAIDLRKLLK